MLAESDPAWADQIYYCGEARLLQGLQKRSKEDLLSQGTWCTMWAAREMKNGPNEFRHAG